MRIELARRFSSHGRPAAALLMTVAAMAVAVGLSSPHLLNASGLTAVTACALAGILVLASVQAQRNWHLLVADLASKTEPEAFPALLDALYRAEQVSAYHASALEKTYALEQEVLTMLQWHLDRPDRLEGVRLNGAQQERLHMALMSEHRELVRGILQALPYLADEDSATYVGKLAEGNWSAEYDSELRRTAERMLAVFE